MTDLTEAELEQAIIDIELMKDSDGKYISVLPMYPRYAPDNLSDFGLTNVNPVREEK